MLGAYGVPIAAGLLALAGNRRQLGLLVWLGLAYPVGGLLVTGCMFILAIVGLPSLPWLVGGLCLLAGAGLSRVLPQMPRAYEDPSRDGPLALTGALLIGLGLGVCAIAAAIASSASPFDVGDPLFMWGYRAKHASQVQGLDWAFLARHRDLHTLHHPPHVPLILAYGMLWRGELAMGFAKLAFPLMYASLLALFAGLLLPLWGGLRAMAWTAAIGTMPVVLYHGQTAYADIFLAVFQVAAFAGLMRARQEDSLLFAVGLAGCAWSKNEGTVAVIILGSLWLWTRRKGDCAALWPLLAAGAPLFAWGVVKRIYALRSYELSFDTWEWSRIPEAIGRIPTVSEWFAHELFWSEQWNFLGGVAVLMAIGAIATRWRQPAMARGLVALLLLLAASMLVYLLVVVSPELLMRASLSRVLMPWGVCLALWLAMAYGDKRAPSSTAPDDHSSRGDDLPASGAGP